MGDICISAVANRKQVLFLLQAETLAIKWGLELAASHNISRVVVESNSMIAISEIKRGEESFWEFRALVVDIRVDFKAFSIVVSVH
ncbi:hypothetical protein REPUB_Repub05bG0084900 [Reevesia pubescens]